MADFDVKTSFGKITHPSEPRNFDMALKPNFQSAEFSERAKILLFARENVALKLNR